LVDLGFERIENLQSVEEELHVEDRGFGPGQQQEQVEGQRVEPGQLGRVVEERHSFVEIGFDRHYFGHLQSSFFGILLVLVDLVDFVEVGSVVEIVYGSCPMPFYHLEEVEGVHSASWHCF